MSFRNLAIVYFNDSSSKFNKELCEFLRDNLERIIIRGNCRFRFEVVKSSQFAALKKKSITELPAISINERIHLGVHKIKKALVSLASSNQEPAVLKSDEEMMREAMLHQLSQGDNEEQNTPDFTRRSAEFEKSRTAQPFKQPSSSFSSSRDDVDQRQEYNSQNTPYNSQGNAEYHQQDTATQFALSQMKHSKGGDDMRDNQMLADLMNKLDV